MVIYLADWRLFYNGGSFGKSQERMNKEEQMKNDQLNEEVDKGRVRYMTLSIQAWLTRKFSIKGLLLEMMQWWWKFDMPTSPSCFSQISNTTINGSNCEHTSGTLERGKNEMKKGIWQENPWKEIAGQLLKISELSASLIFLRQWKPQVIYRKVIRTLR